MGVYSIKDLENFTQIKAHTLRIWEQRYNLLKPTRTDTNIRLYSDQDLKKILNINLLYTNGLKISKIAKLNENEIFKLANEILMVPSSTEASQVDCFMNQIMRYDEVGLRKELTDRLSGGETLEQLFSDLLIPVLKKIGELWQVDSITAAHEHFFSNIIRDFIIRHTDEPLKLEDAKASAILFLREDEYHEIGLLFYNYFLRKRGYHTIYLGQAIPLNDLKRIVLELKPKYLFTSLIAKVDKDEFSNFFSTISEFFDLKDLYVGGFQLRIFDQHIPKKVNVIHTVDGIDIQ